MRSFTKICRIFLSIFLFLIKKQPFEKKIDIKGKYLLIRIYYSPMNPLNPFFFEFHFTLVPKKNHIIGTYLIILPVDFKAD